MQVLCRPGAEQRVWEDQVPGQAQVPLCPHHLHVLSLFCFKGWSSVSWDCLGAGGVPRANAHVLPHRSAPVVCHSRPLCGPAGRAGPLPRAVMVLEPGRRALGPPWASLHCPLLKTQPELTSLCDPPPRQLLRPSAAGTGGKGT